MLPIAILAGGLATRLRPITETIPKALIEIAGEPFLAHQLRLLRHSGFERVVLCVGHLDEQIREFAGEQLRAAGDADTARSAYYAWMLKLALAARHGLDGPEQPNWLRAIQEEHQNVREVLSLAIDNEDAELDARFLAGEGAAHAISTKRARLSHIVRASCEPSAKPYALKR